MKNGLLTSLASKEELSLWWKNCAFYTCVSWEFPRFWGNPARSSDVIKIGVPRDTYTL